MGSYFFSPPSRFFFGKTHGVFSSSTGACVFLPENTCLHHPPPGKMCMKMIEHVRFHWYMSQYLLRISSWGPVAPGLFGPFVIDDEVPPRKDDLGSTYPGQLIYIGGDREGKGTILNGAGELP